MEPTIDPAQQENSMRIVSLVLALLLVFVVAPAALEAQTGDLASAQSGGTAINQHAAPATWSPTNLGAAATSNLFGRSDTGADTDPDGVAASSKGQGLLHLGLAWLQELFRF